MGCEEHVDCANRNGSGDEWEVLEFNSAPSSIRGEDEEDPQHRLSVEIELGNFIDADYFACPSSELSLDVNPAGNLCSDVVDDGLRDRKPAEALHSEEEVILGKEDEESLGALLAAKEVEGNLGALATGSLGSGVIEGLCIFRPLVVTELALFRVDSSFNSWKVGKGEEEGLKVVAIERISSCPSSPRLSRPSSPQLSRPSSPRVNCCNVEPAKCEGGKANFINQLGIWTKNIGMLSSFGMAAAVMGLVILGSRFYLRKGNQNKNRNQGLVRFQVYGDNRKIGQLMSQAARLNEALSAAKIGIGGGVPVVRAQISFGGYCDGL
ncbi:hypothetical protein SUGI_0115190 [Cryptomeria japonica]|uniref:uncharacterized protein LOC131054261 n=1 Tax=Cryptomeria japonica TaxID=3369 RepID=UPI002408E9C2|nr:uncharacterized protein LOC131054261 [Cryptomeria japonica]GLJ09750.1 hypothetical protein SUGI_0115190 [Cryptomeria japonica]